MPWPTVPVVTTGMDADTDTLPRTDILDHAQKFNQLIAMRGLASGVCDLDASALIPSARLPAVYQPVDATLTALAALATGADQLPYSTGADTFAQTPLTAFARTLLDDADAATARATLELVTVTQAAAEAGTETTTRTWTAERVKQAIAALAPLAPLAKSYISADQAITSGGALTLAHGLGSVPKFLSVYLKCLTAEAGYSVGDIVQAPITNADSGGDSKGISITVDATNLNIRIGSSAVVYNLLNKGTGTGGNVTNANWNLLFRGWA